MTFGAFPAVPRNCYYDNRLNTDQVEMKEDQVATAASVAGYTGKVAALAATGQAQ